MEEEREELPQDRWYWGWYGIFLVLLGVCPFIIWEHPGWGIFYGVFGLGGLFILMRDGLKAHLGKIPISRIPVRPPIKAVAVIALSILIGQTAHLVLSTRSDLNTYVMPRTVTEKQYDALHDYFSHHQGNYAVKITVNANDREAVQYGLQLASALSKAGWEANCCFSSEKLNEKLDNMSSVSIGFTRQNLNPYDEKHDPRMLLNEALMQAEIDGGGSSEDISSLLDQSEYKLFLLIGRRPFAIHKQPRFAHVYRRIFSWLME